MIVPLLSLAVSLPAAPVPAPKLERPGAGKLPPLVVWITPERDGKFSLVEVKQEFVPVQRQATVQEGGQQRQVTWTEMVPVSRTVQRTLDVERVNFYGLDGKKLEAKAVRKLLTKDMPALLSADGKPVDRFYLHLAREGTLVLVVPPSAPPTREGAKPAPEPVRKLPPEPKKE